MRTCGFLAVVALLLAPAAMLDAQAQPDGPTSLVISYAAKHDSRAKFIEYLETAGLKQFDSWRHAGTFRDYQLLYSAYGSGSVSDAVVILNFDRYSDTRRWQEIEKRMPGGLTPEGQALAVAQSSTLCDVAAYAEGENRRPAAAQYMLLRYDVLVEAARYRQYVQGYVVPQFQGWLRDGALTGFWIYAPQNPGGLWSAFIVLEYADIDALARREIVKSKVRADLAANDPVWKKFSDDKTAMRKELEAAIYRAVVHP